jgi:8-oxo-dGTP pyrophosphatase MutT (NUDIX family)
MELLLSTDTFPWLPMRSGKRFCVARPRPEDITIDDIATGLGNECRFGGQIEFYSVGQHVVHVSQLLEEQGHGPLLQMHGLLHDCSEGLGLKDMPRSVKTLLGAEYKRLEAAVMEAVYQSLGLPEPTEEEYRIVKLADDALGVTEWRDLVKRHTCPQRPRRAVEPQDQSVDSGRSIGAVPPTLHRTPQGAGWRFNQPMNYVLGFLFDGDRVALVEKAEPKWQRGYLNGIGGKIDATEGPFVAMVREFREETGAHIEDWREFAVLRGSDWMVHCFVAHGFRLLQSVHYPSSSKERLPEYIGWHHINSLGDDATPVLANIKWLVHLALDRGTANAPDNGPTFSEISYT